MTMTPDERAEEKLTADEDPPNWKTAVVDRIEQLQNDEAIAVLEFLDGKKLNVLTKHLPNPHAGAVYVMEFDQRPKTEARRRREIGNLQDKLIEKPDDD